MALSSQAAFAVESGCACGELIDRESCTVGDAGDARAAPLLLRSGAGAASGRGAARVAHGQRLLAGRGGCNADRLVVRSRQIDRRSAARSLLRGLGRPRVVALA